MIPRALPCPRKEIGSPLCRNAWPTAEHPRRWFGPGAVRDGKWKPQECGDEDEDYEEEEEEDDEDENDDDEDDDDVDGYVPSRNFTWLSNMAI